MYTYSGQLSSSQSEYKQQCSCSAQDSSSRGVADLSQVHTHWLSHASAAATGATPGALLFSTYASTISARASICTQAGESHLARSVDIALACPVLLRMPAPRFYTRSRTVSIRGLPAPLCRCAKGVRKRAFKSLSRLQGKLSNI